MALLANLPIRYSGSTTENMQYWKISDIAISYEQERATIHICSYTSREASRSFDDRGRPIRPIDRKIITVKDEELFKRYFSINNLSEISTNPLQMAYLYVKENIKDFRESSDV